MYAANAAMNQQFPNAVPLKAHPSGDDKDKRGLFDRVYKDGDKVYIVEAKGAGGQRDARRDKDGKLVEQGTQEYWDAIIQNMKEKARRTGGAELMDTVGALEDAVETGKLEYLEISQKTDGSKMKPQIQISKYK